MNRLIDSGWRIGTRIYYIIHTGPLLRNKYCPVLEYVANCFDCILQNFIHGLVFYALLLNSSA